MTTVLSPTRYGEDVSHHARHAAHIPQQPQQQWMQTNSASTEDMIERGRRATRISSFRRRITGLLTFTSQHQKQSTVSDMAPTLPPLSFADANPSTPEPAHIHSHNQITTLDPAHIPLPVSTLASTPMLFGETTPCSPAMQYTTNQDTNVVSEDITPRRRSLLNQFICPNPNQHNLATVLLHRADQRQKRAWVRKRSHPSNMSHEAARDDMSSPAPLLPQESPHHHRPRKFKKHHQQRNKKRSTRTLHAFIFGTLLIILLSSYLALALTQDGVNGHAKLPIALHVVFVLLLILVAVLFLHALIRSIILSARRRQPSHHHKHRRAYHHRHRRPRPRALDLEAALPVQDRHGGDEGGDEHDANHTDPNALPNEDITYTPTSPIRVHLLSDPLPLAKTPLITHDPVIVSPPASATSFPSRRRSSPTSPLSPAPRRGPGLRQQGQTVESSPSLQARGAGTENELAYEQEQAEEAVAVPAAPPSYGEWRCSVRADPNLLFWQRITPPTSPEHTPNRADHSASRRMSAQPQLASPQPSPHPQLQHPSSPTVIQYPGSPAHQHSPPSPAQATPPAAAAATIISAPPAYSDVLRERERAAREQMRREDQEGDWPLSAGFGGAMMDQGVTVVVEDEVGVERRGSGGSGSVARLTRELLRDGAHGA